MLRILLKFPGTPTLRAGLAKHINISNNLSENMERGRRNFIHDAVTKSSHLVMDAILE